MSILRRLLGLLHPIKPADPRVPTLTLEASVNPPRLSDPEDKPTSGHVVDSEVPEGRCIFRDVSIAGISYRASAAGKFVNGSKHRLQLEREPDNPHDTNAVKVIGVWTDARGVEHRNHLGYVPREIAARIAMEYTDITITAVPVVVFRPLRAEATPGVRFDIFGNVSAKPRKKRASKKKATGTIDL